MLKMVKTKINGRWDILLPEHRAKRPEWTAAEGWEKARLDSMFKKIGKGDVVYYVGAEEGEMPALLQMWGAAVVLFEPNPLVWPNIKAIWEANNLSRPMGLMVGFASNKQQMIPPEDKDSTYWSLRGENDWPECAYGEITIEHGFKDLKTQGDAFPQYTIDDCVKLENKLEPPTIISIDVEGSEWRVLEGATETIKQFMPKIWLSGHPEAMFEQYGEYLNELRYWLKELGYAETLLAYEHEVHLLYEQEARV